MARDKAIIDNIDGSDLANYPNKRIRDNDGSGNGTPVNEFMYGDIHEFFAKLMRDSKTSYNNLPDSVGNDYQLYDALMQIAGKNSLIKNITEFDSTTLEIPIKIGILKVDETLVFKSNLNSINTQNGTTTYNKIKGTDPSILTKSLVIAGHFKEGDYVRLVNIGNQIIAFGLYDSINVPNLVDRLNSIEAAIQPMIQKLSVFQSGGGMLFWNQPAALIPDGWQEVVDWRGRFPVGMDIAQTEFAVLGGEGGNKNKTLSIDEIPPHNHGSIWIINQDLTNNGPTNGFGSNGATAPTSTQGGGQSFSLLNPYRVVLFIEYIL